ncbi:MAG: hypothetical protein HOY76_08485 [Streptomyces sp.]|nr:hypothetical protein [Streptomyces sp.]
MADEPTLGEVVRRLEDVRQDLKEDVRDLGGRLDSKVDQQVYDLRHEALTARVIALETLREKDADRVSATRRWLIGAVIVPVVGIVLPTILLLMRGGG